MDSDIIVQHETKTDWGHAILAWQRGNKRGYQFEDGKLRVFKRGWFGRLHEVDLPAPKAAAISEQLQRKLGLAPKRVLAANYDGISFGEQLLLFDHFYPGGFSGDAWAGDKRGAGATRRLKRHRGAAIADARDTLGAEALEAMIAAERFDDAWNAILGVLRRTDLVTATHVKPLEGISTDARRDIVLRTRELLWGDDAFDIRFERYVGALALATGKQPSWQLATALIALHHPSEHVCVRPGSIRAQASWMAPRLRLSNTPSAPLYNRLLRVLDAVRSELADAGMPPRDLLDVHDFMWTTLRPSARKKLDEIKAIDNEEALQHVA